MFKDTITYTDFNGNAQTETLYFNLSSTEMVDMQFSVEGGLSEELQKMVDNQDMIAMYNFIKDVIVKSYGIKSEDGKRFIKNPQVLEEFIQSAAYDAFIAKILQGDNVIAFMDGIIPSDIQTMIDNDQKNELIEKFKNHPTQNNS